MVFMIVIFPWFLIVYIPFFKKNQTKSLYFFMFSLLIGMDSETGTCNLKLTAFVLAAYDKA